MPASIAYDVNSGHCGHCMLLHVAGRKFSPASVTALTIRSAVGTRLVFSDPATASRG